MWVSFDCVLITQNPSGQVTLTPYDAYMTSLYFRGPVAGSFQHTLWPRGRASQVALLVRGAFAFIFGWYKVIIALFDHNRSLYSVKPSYILLTLRASWFAWCLSRIYQLNKSRCRCRWNVTIEYLAYIMFEKQLTALHVVPMFHLFNRCVFILLTKMRARTKTIPSTWRGHQFKFVKACNLLLMPMPLTIFVQQFS